MSEDNTKHVEKVGPVIVDAAVFSPAPTNTFVYEGKKYPAFNLGQVPRGVRNRFAALGEHISACKSWDEQARVVAEMIVAFSPSAPLDLLLEESLDLLVHSVLHLGNAITTGTAARPTKGRKKSSKRTNTPA